MKRSVLGAPPHKGTGAAIRLFIRSAAGAAALGALLALSPLGCAGSLDPGVTGGGGGLGGNGGGGGTACQDTIFMNQCVSCHASASNSAGLDLQSPNVAARLVGQPSFTGAGAICGGKTLLDAGSTPATGFFIDKITNSPPSCGVVMPFGVKMNAADIACLTTWANGVTVTQ